MGSGFQGESGGLTGESVLPGADREEGQQPCENRNVQQSNIKLQKGPRGNSTVWPLTEYTEQREGLHQRCRGGKRLEGATRAVPGKEELGSEPGCANAGPEMQRGLGLG